MSLKGLKLESFKNLKVTKNGGGGVHTFNTHLKGFSKRIQRILQIVATTFSHT